METNMNTYERLIFEVLVFKTNVSSDEDVKTIGRLLATKSKITRWNIDRDDIDKVLRIECEQIKPETVVNLLCHAGFECRELPD